MRAVVGYQRLNELPPPPKPIQWLLDEKLLPAYFGEGLQALVGRIEVLPTVGDIILETIEPDSWLDNGGDSASIRYYEGVLIIRAPDFIQRQIGGYPFAPNRRASSSRPRASASGTGSTPVATIDRRYVTFTAPFSIIENVTFDRVPVTGSAGR